MKKHLIAAAALATLSTAAFAQSVTVYGIIDQSVWSANNQKEATTSGVQAEKRRTSMENGAWLPSVIGFTGTEDLGGGLKANFKLEGNVFTDTGATDTALFARQSWVGLSGGFGEFRAGKQIDALFLQQFVNNIRLSHSNSAALASGLGIGGFVEGAGGLGSTYKGGVFSENTVTYVTPSAQGLQATLQYGMGEQSGSTSAGSSTAVLVNYSGIKNVALNLGTKTQKAADQADGKLYTMNMLGGSYTMGALKFAAQTITTKAKSATASYVAAANGDKQTLNEFGVSYSISPKLTAAANYVDATYKGADGYKAEQDSTSVSLKYDFSKRTAVWLMAARASAVKASDGNDGSTAGLMATPYYLNNFALSGATADTRKSVTGYGVGVTHTF